MKKIFTLFVALLTAAVSMAELHVGLAYEAGAEIVSSYIWRGQYNGGLSFQPDLEIGYDGLLTSLRIGAWANIGASDWKFQKGLPLNEDESNPNTLFVPELDIIGSFTVVGLSVGFNHYYYCDGSKFFSVLNPQQIYETGQTSSTEVWIGYNFNHFFNHGAYINWYTTIAGNDILINEETNKARRAWSSYLEIGYDYTFESVGITIGAQVGMSPWTSDLYGNTGFAVVNVNAKFHKEWELDVVTLDLFATGSINPDGLITDPKNPDYNVFVNAAGDDKLCKQKLNGTIGLGIWF